MSHSFCDLGPGALDEDGNLLVQCKDAPVSEDGTAPDFGDTPIMCALGLTAMPFPATEEGSAEAIVADDLPGVDGVVIGARDVRTANIVGNLKPGDTVLHSTGPEQAAQIQLKEEKRQVVARTKDTRGKDMAVVVDGKNDKVSVTAMGMLIEMSRDNGVNVVGTGGAGIQLVDGKVIFTGQVFFQRTPLGSVLVAPNPASPPAGSVPVPGVFA